MSSANAQASITIVKAKDPHALTLSTRASCLVFEDPASYALLERAQRIARSEATVLIIGETGTGKELIARHLHERSARHQGPFIAVNCAAITDSLMESELFGHERGAFTGAVASKAGWFETAHGGSLFLDEIGDLPLPLQAKLLRVVQEREVVPVGSRQPVAVDVRLIAATNVRLDEAVRAGRFREDLYYRLNVASLELPPLRQRTADVLPLAQHFLAEYGNRLGYSVVELSPSAARALLAYPWPGNIRELENTIHHALLVCSGSIVQPEDLRLPAARPPEITASTAPVRPARLEEGLRHLFDADTPDLYRLIDETVFQAAYEYCERNQLRTARLLGISRNIVRDRLLRYGLLKTQREHA
ncbi:sigma-54-dependent Fis family transcriptional regulator [Nitrospira sp. KM1]|uniref:sigma-54 interaction domain-containing protein n=1 Tax=Nitrospira sp. KM1 TaxID=1936990 RepID=UPI00156386DE|nr:sigma-54 dependent transcriptional regulator [Nitrospira sp. KM1]